jgi:hypothetical protein
VIESVSVIAGGAIVGCVAVAADHPVASAGNWLINVSFQHVDLAN